MSEGYSLFIVIAMLGLLIGGLCLYAYLKIKRQSWFPLILAILWWLLSTMRRLTTGESIEALVVFLLALEISCLISIEIRSVLVTCGVTVRITPVLRYW